MNERMLAMAIEEQERDRPDVSEDQGPCRCGAPPCTDVEPGPWLS
jgi:hypothetical protein